MPDAVLSDSLSFILNAIALIEERSAGIRSPEGFVDNAQGLLLLDGISMRLQAISEHVKRIETKVPGTFQSAGFDPQPIIRFRDFISHHYDEVDYEVIYDVCKHHLTALKSTVISLLKNLS